MAQITFANKVKLDDDPSIPAINKVRDVDMNEIKEVVNQNDDDFQNTLPTVLYSDSTGTTGNVTLSDDSSNYTTFEIFFKKDDYQSSVKVDAGYASLIAHYTNMQVNTTYVDFKNILISGTTITVISYMEWYNNWGTTGVTAGKVNGIYITKVLGYK